MKLYMLYATETRGEAFELARLLNRRLGIGITKVARPEADILEKPLRYMVLTTSETLAKNRELIDDVRTAVMPPRFPKLQLVREWFFDTLINFLEALTRLVAALKGARSADNDG